MGALSNVIYSRWMLVSDTCSIAFIIYGWQMIRYQCDGIEGWMLWILGGVGLVRKFGWVWFSLLFCGMSGMVRWCGWVNTTRATMRPN